MGPGLSSSEVNESFTVSLNEKKTSPIVIENEPNNRPGQNNP